ncbi:MAG: hypothetical protein HYZ25_03355 [Chloroflexi bacterium]|nr:hypothetical protein [Chloroflexota bacterium]
MKHNLSRKRTIIIATALLLLCLVFGVINTVFTPFSDFVYRSPHFAEGSSTGSYHIDPQTLLTSLTNGETDAFFPATTTSDAPTEQDPILWQQSDYLMIANAAFDVQWTDRHDGWYLSFVVFEANCQNFSKGFYDATFTYYKEVWHGMELRYLGRQIDILPQYHKTNWSGDAYYYPPLFYFEKSIDLNNLSIGANHAIDMAEQNGGSAVRSQVKNQCSIWVILNGSEKRGWNVIYEGEKDMLSAFEIYIDPYTGKISQK